MRAVVLGKTRTCEFHLGVLRSQARHELSVSRREHGFTRGGLIFQNQQPAHARLGTEGPPIPRGQAQIKIQCGAKFYFSRCEISATQEHFADEVWRRGYISMARGQRLRVDRQRAARVTFGGGQIAGDEVEVCERVQKVAHLVVTGPVTQGDDSQCVPGQGHGAL